MTQELPKSWALTTLERVADWGAGGTPSRKNSSFFKGNIPWVKTGELGPKYIKDAIEKITEEAIKKSSAKIFPKGSVGIAMYGATIGKLSIWDIDASTNQACAVGKPKKNILFNEFLYYFLMSEKRDFINAAKGGAQPNISQGMIKEWPFNLPPLNEQKRIVAKIEELFSELDKGIESLKTTREQLKVYRQAILKHAFKGKLTKKWREDNDITDEWEQDTIGNICTVNPKHKDIDDNLEISFVPMPAMNQDTARIDKHETRKFVEVKKGYTHFAENDVLFAKITPCMENGKNGLATNLKNGLACGSTEFMVFRCGNKILPQFLLMKFRDTLFRRIAEANMTGAVGQRRVPKPWMEKVVMPLPSIKEQEVIVEEVQILLDQMNKIEDDIEYNVSKTEALRQSILKKAFSGKLVAQDPSDEPASVLRERVKSEKQKETKKRKVA